MSFRSAVPRAPRRPGARSALLVLLALLGGLCAGPTHAATEVSSPGQARFVKRMDGTFNRYVENSAHRTFLNQKFWRMEVFTTYFDGMTSWYPKGWVYSDAIAIKADDGIPDGDVARRGKWILKDTAGRPLYVNYDCTASGCSQYAADITNPAFRADWIASLKGAFARGNYRGAWIDDVNMVQTLARSATDTAVTAYSPALGRAITDEDWRKAMATFMEEIRAALPADKEILHNSPWSYGLDPKGGYYREVDRQIKAADYVNREFGVVSPGSGMTSAVALRELFTYIDLVHSLGKGVVLDDTASGSKEDVLAPYLLISTGRDGVSDGVGADGTTPESWWSGWDADLGQPKGERFRWNGMLRRDFAGGMVLYKEPGAATGAAVSLGASMKNLAGQTVTSATLAAKQGLVLTGTPPALPAASKPTISTMSPTSWKPWTEVTINGTNLADAELSVEGTPVELKSNTATQLVANLPDLGYAGAAEVKVTTRGGSATTTFTYLPWDTSLPAPTVTSLSPSSGAYDKDAEVKVAGTGLTGASVLVDDRPVAVSAASATSLTIVVPAGSAPGSATIKVRTPGGNTKTTFTRVAAGPQVTGVSRVVFGANVIAIISGSGFTDATQVRFGSVPAATMLVNDDEEVLAIEPAQPTGSVVDLRVTTPAGTSPVVAADRWTYLPFPRITSVSRSSGPETGGTYVIVWGADLADAKVTVGGVTAPSYGNSTRLAFITPPGKGVQYVVITTPDGVAKTRFKYLPAG